MRKYVKRQYVKAPAHEVKAARDHALRVRFGPGYEKIGLRFHRMYWGIVHRCTNPKREGYHRYGGRGITIAPDLQPCSAFFAYVKTLPGWNTPGLLIDRIDNDSGYRRGNLRFVTPSVSVRNRSLGK